LLKLLGGGPADYVAFSQDYYETAVSLDLVSLLFDHVAITEAMVSALNPSITLREIFDELYSEIGYPR